MNARLPLVLSLLITPALFAADASPKETVLAAAAKLAAAPNYGWKAVVTVPESARFRPGPTEGKTEKDGFTHVTWQFGDNTSEAVIKGEKAALTNRDGDWQSVSELENAEGPGRFLAMRARGTKPPAATIPDLVKGVAELTMKDDAYVGDLSAESVREQFRFGEPKDPKGSVKFWIKDGMLAKYEVKLSAMMEFNGEEFDASRTTTTEIKDVGKTKVEVSAAAADKLK